MREPDDIAPVSSMDYYNKSLDLSDQLGIRNDWEKFFLNLYRSLEQQEVVFERRVRQATQQTNQHFNMEINAGINEHDYV